MWEELSCILHFALFLMDSRLQDSDAKGRKSVLHKLMFARGEYRKLAQLPSDWRVQLDEIQASFPNFSEVIDCLRAMFVMVECGDRIPRLDPMLLNGPPGVGKSLFAERMSNFFGSGFFRLPMENAQSNSKLVGSDEFWSNSKSGAVFEALVEKDWANPVFYLDEVDKVNAHIEYNPLAALYGLLEPDTAAVFHDMSMPGIQLDASRILWILTCNDSSLIPDPIKSRVRCFDVPNPTPEQARKILLKIYGQVQSELKSKSPLESLSKEVISALARVPPRKQKQIIREAIGRAIFNCRNVIVLSDLQIPPDSCDDKRRIGFY